MTEDQSRGDSFSKFSGDSEVEVGGEEFRSSEKSESHMQKRAENVSHNMNEYTVNHSSICGSNREAPVSQDASVPQHEPRSPEQGLAAESSTTARRGAPKGLDQDRTPATTVGARTGTWRTEREELEQDRAPGVGGSDQSGPNQEGDDGGAMCQGPGDEPLRERDHSHLGANGHAEGAPDFHPNGHRCGGIRTPRSPRVPGHQLVPSGVPRVGASNGCRGDGMRLPVASLGPVAKGKSCGQDREGGAEQAEVANQGKDDEREPRRSQFLGTLQRGPRHADDPAEPHGHDPGLEGGDGGAEGRTASEARSRQEPIGDHVRRVHEGAAEVRTLDSSLEAPVAYEAQGTQLSAGRASQLEQQSWEIVPGLFQGLVSYGRLALLEVGCEPNSFLTTAVQELLGEESAARRLSSWNGADLGSTDGVKLVLQQISVLRPGVVWLSPSDTPFSPMQHSNSRTEEQKCELQLKRRQARKTFEGTAIIYRYCVQQGIHCVWSMSEKSDAWRLPLLQNLQKQYPSFAACTHGCQVGLRGKDRKQLIKKGWKLITTHARLAQIMESRCRCPREQVHGRCEGEASSRSRMYTEEYARRAAEAITMELNHVSVCQECHGHTQLPEAFGEGGTCQCRDLNGDPGARCGWCLQGDVQIFDEASGLQGNPKPQATQAEVLEPYDPEEGHYAATELIHAEEYAKELLQRQDFSEAACLELVKRLPLKAQQTREGKLGSDKVMYHVFGAYAHGNQYGNCSRTKQMHQSVKYLNQFLKNQTPSGCKWTSIVVNQGTAMPMHRDVNNLATQPNIVLGMGQYDNGGLWVQDTEQAREMGLNKEDKPEQLTARRTPHGEEVWGRVHPTRGQVVMFPPKAWHQTEEWSGERVVLSAYSSRGLPHLEQQELEELR